jgi:anti-repressor protein
MDIQVFDNEQFGALRTYEEDGRILFCGKDVAKALGYAKPNNAINSHCKGALKRRPLQTAGGVQEFVFITEPGLYRLITHSKLPTAEKFERWVFEEVLPSIRRTGGYMVAKQDETPEQIMARAVLVAQDTIERQKREIAELKPKALFADAVAASDGTCLVGELAKMLKQNGVNIGQNRLFSWLRENGYLGKTGSNRNVPTQRAMEQGLFRIKETAVTHSDGHVTINRTPKVTGKGQRYFIEAFAKRGDLVG